jgi:hypothetical protein
MKDAEDAKKANSYRMKGTLRTPKGNSLKFDIPDLSEADATAVIAILFPPRPPKDPKGVK